MNKLNKIQKILISCIIIMMAVLTKSAVSQGVYFGGYTTPPNPLYDSKEYYCIELGGKFNGGDWEEYERTTIQSDHQDQSQRALAYILREGVRTGNGGYNHYSRYQIALWKWFNVNKGLADPFNHYDTSQNATQAELQAGKDLWETAANINAIPYSNESAAVEGSSKKITMTGLTGSIKLKKLTGKVSKVVVEWKDPLDNDKTYTQTITAGTSKVNDWVGFYSDKDCTQELKIEDFGTNTFYLKNFKENYQVKSVTIHTEAKASGYAVTAIKWRKTSGASSAQDLMSAIITEGQDTQASAQFTTEYSYGKIKLLKQGVYIEDGEEKTENLTATFKIYCTTLGKWVSGDASGYKTYVSNIEEASTYKSGTTVSGLFSTYQYEVVEVAVDSDYYNNPMNMVAATSNLQSDLQIEARDSYHSAVGIIVYDRRTNTVTIKNERTSGDLTIYKVDDTYNKVVLKGAKIKVYLKDTGWLIKNSDGTYSYDGTEDTATEFETDNNGEVKLSCIKLGTYYVYETKAPEGYDITKQDGYINQNGEDPYSFSENNKWAYLGYKELGNEDNSVTFTATNKKIVDKLEGYVWVDEPDTKENVTDNIYNNQSKDFLKEGITVNLYDGMNTLIATTTTDAKGYYQFTTKNAPSYTGEDKNIYYWDLARAYVEFIYNNKTTYNADGTVKEYGYITVDPFVGTNASINSKAQEETITTEKLDDNNLTGTTGNNPGRAVTYRSRMNLSEAVIKYDSSNGTSNQQSNQPIGALSEDELLENTKNISEKIKNNTVTYDDLRETPLTGYYDNETYKVSNINLGLLEQQDPQFTVDETLAYIKVKMKGYTYTYKYGDAAVTTSTNVPTVNEQNSAKTFTGKIYPTDIAYNMAESAEELQVYVVYSIDVKNTETTYIDNQYVEEKLYLDELVNAYDTNRYALCNNENNNDKTDFALWKDNGNGTASYDVNHKDSAYQDGMKPQETKTSYIQFKMKEEALEKILKGGLTYEDIENAPTIATATGYHEYLRTDNVWVHSKNVRAFNGCKGANNYPTSNDSGKKYYVHKSISKSFSSSDLYLRLSLGEARTVSGTVFEDTRTDESEKNNTYLGNGILDDTETNRAKAVTVELLNADKTTVTKLYKESDGKIVYQEDGITLPDAVATTEIGGTYTFEGVVPGYYYIRFTYGDGTQKMMPADSAINSNDYKSTIINTEENGAGSIIKNAMEASEDDLKNAQQTLLKDPSNKDAKMLVEWYKYLTQSYSTAVDDTTQRLQVENYIYHEDGTISDASGKPVTDYPTSVSSYTPMAGISIENDENDFTDNGNFHSPKYDEFNFGIIKQADTEISLGKKITNVALTTQTGSTLVSANPKDRTASYVTALDKIDGGSKYAKVEIDPSLIYGSELATTYELTITNNSVKDYIEEEGTPEFGYYYKYGEVTSTAELKKITVKEVIDELDEKYNYDTTANQLTETVIHEGGRTETNNLTVRKPEVTTTTSSTETTTETNPDGSTTTTTNNNLSITGWSGIESQASTSTNYTVTSLLSSQDDDTLYSNAARITSISLDKLTTLNSNFTWGDNLKDTTTLTITPTTGSDRSNTYWIAGAIALVVIAAGFVVLKKKVLK